MSTLFCFIQIISGSSGYHFFLMLQVIGEHLQKIHDHWLVIIQSQHNHAKSILQLGMLIELIQNYVGIYITAQFDIDPHTFSAGFICQRCDTIDFLFFYQICNLFNQSGFIYQIRQLCNDDPGLAIWQCLHIGHCTDTDLATSGTICFFNSSGSQNLGTSWEVRSFHNLQDLFDLSISAFFNTVINDLNDRIDYLSKIVRRDIGCHTYCNTGSSVTQQIRIAGWQHGWFFFCFIKVRCKIYRIFIDVRQHLHGDLA